MRAALADVDYSGARAADYGPNGAAANPVQIRPVIDYIDDQLTSAKGATAVALRRARGTLMTDGQPDMSVTGHSNARNAITDQISAAARAAEQQPGRVLQDVLGQLDNALEQVPALWAGAAQFRGRQSAFDAFCRRHRTEPHIGPRPIRPKLYAAH